MGVFNILAVFEGKSRCSLGHKEKGKGQIL